MISGALLEHAWIPITVFAALMQTLRTSLQKKLALNLSTAASTLARYLYGLPVAIAYLLIVRVVNADAQVSLNAAFYAYCVIGGVAQIVATAFLIKALTARSYAVGTALSKTEAIQAALMAAAILGEHITTGGLIALIISAIGVMSMSASGKTWTFSFDQAAVYGLLSGTLFGVTAVGIRGANLALNTDFVTAAAHTLASMVVLQTVLLVVYLAWTEREQLTALLIAWKPASGVGLFSALGSIGWFSGMALENAAYVRTLGQVELVFTVLAGRFYFHETLRPREFAGMVLIVAGIVILVLVG